MSDVVDAYEAWQNAKRGLQMTLPWTADWLRLRTIEQDRRAAYFAMIDRDAGIPIVPDVIGPAEEPHDRPSGTVAEAPPT